MFNLNFLSEEDYSCKEEAHFILNPSDEIGLVLLSHPGFPDTMYPNNINSLWTYETTLGNVIQIEIEEYRVRLKFKLSKTFRKMTHCS